MRMRSHRESPNARPTNGGGGECCHFAVGSIPHAPHCAEGEGQDPPRGEHEREEDRGRTQVPRGGHLLCEPVGLG